MKNQLVSVLIPAYNHEKYVQDTIKSIIAQTYKNIELIIIDDGSKDSCWEKIQELKEECEKRFVRIHFETKINEGTCKTLNKLLSLAQGDYVYIIASDDIAKENSIEIEVDFLNKNTDFALVVGNNEIIDADNKVCYWDKNRNIVYSKKDARYLTFVDFLKINRLFNFTSNEFGTYKTLYPGNYIPNGYLIRKSIFEKIGYFTPEAPLEDWWLMLQISKYAKMKYIDKILFSYRWHLSNTIKNDEKMKTISQKTREYEEILLKNIDENTTLQDVAMVKKYGVCYKKRGIPFIFQNLYFQRGTRKIKISKLFNIKIFEKIKNY